MADRDDKGSDGTDPSDPHQRAREDAAVLESSAAMHAEDFVKIGSWDIRGADQQPVRTVDALAVALGWGGDVAEELRAFMLLPAFRAAPAALRREIRDILTGPRPPGAPSALELVVLANRHDPEVLADALLRFPWATGERWPVYRGGDWTAYLAAYQPVADSPDALHRFARAWGVPDSVLDRMTDAWRSIGIRVHGPRVPVTTASDFDGIRHAVALIDDVDGWTVTVRVAGRERPADGPEPFSGYDQTLFGKPSWDVDITDSWHVQVHGVPVGTVLSLPDD